MSGLTQTEAEWLRTQVDTVRRMGRQSAACLLRIGHILTEVHARLGRGRFHAWVEAEFGWSRSVATQMMHVAAAFGGVPAETLGRFGTASLYDLARTSTPPHVRESLLADAAAGRRFTRGEVRATIAAARGSAPKRRPAGRRAASAGAGPLGRGETSDAACGAQPLHGPDPLEVLAGRALAKLVADGGRVMLGRLPDAEEDDDAARPGVCHVYRGDSPPAVFVSKDGALSALTLAAGLQPPRACKGCGETKPLYDGFSRKSHTPLGRGTVCRKCETRRVGEGKRLKRGTLVRTPEADAAKRAAVRDFLTGRPDATDREVVAACGCSHGLAGNVRREMGIPSRDETDRDKADAARRELRADPHRSHEVLADLTGLHPHTVRRIRLGMEAAGEIPRSTTRVGVNGTPVQVIELAEGEVGSVDELTAELSGAA